MYVYAIPFSRFLLLRTKLTLILRYNDLCMCIAVIDESLKTISCTNQMFSTNVFIQFTI